jgi:hypothetical protein
VRPARPADAGAADRAGSAEGAGPVEVDTELAAGLDADLAAWQEIDWRFTLPAGELRTVAFVGPLPAGEARALRALGAEVAPGDGDPAGPRPGTGAQADVVVVTAATPDALDAALRAVRPGGWALVRLATGLRRGRRGVAVDTGPGWERRLRRGGLGDVTAFWHAPSRTTCSYIVPTRDRDGLAFVLRRWHGIRLGRLKSLVARALLAAGLFPYAARHVTVAGRVPGGDGAAPANSAVLEAAGAHGAGAGSVVLVTPWFEASRHVVGIIFRDGEPACVVKVPRRPGDDSGVERERRSLGRLAAVSPTAAAHAPRVLAAPGGPALVEEAVTGEALGPELVRASPARALRLGMAFVDAMPVTGNSGTDPAWYDRLLGAPLDRFRREAPPELGAEALVASAHRHLRPLRDAALPLVFEHGDVGHPNLVVRPDGRLAALDWERSEERGLPGHDAVFLLAYLAEARRGAFAIEDRLRAVDDAFLGPAAWARDALAAHLARRGVDAALLPPLVLACWARSACGLLDRLAGPPGADVTRPLDAATVVADRDVALWRHIDRRYDSLR